MSGHRPVTDADLIAQLRRRSTGRGVESDLWVRDFVAGVDTKINAGAYPARNSRLPALAGLAAVAAVVLVLIVAIPGITPSSTAPATREAPPVSAMDARDFAGRLAAGELNGQQVLVTARILPYDGPLLYGATCSVERELSEQPNFTCTLGRLDGIDPPVYVDGSYAATPPGKATFFPGAPYVWEAPQPPIEGVLALLVDEFERVTFVGRDLPDRITSSLNEVSVLDLGSVALDEIRVVPAWLTGIVAPISCGPPDPGTYIADLPGRGCANPTWLAPDPMPVDPNGYRIPDDWLQVQSNAYLDFAPNPAGTNGAAEPRAGLYVIAKRLEGSGCPDNAPPCWQWEIVGRITINGDGTEARPPVAPKPSAVPIRRLPFSCHSEVAEMISVSFEDTTGLVTGCSVMVIDRHNQTGATNPNGDLSTLQILWGTSRCTGAASLEFKRAADAYVVEIRESAAAPDCEALPEAYAVEVALSAPVRAETVRVSVVPGATSNSPSAARVFECVGRPLPPEEPPYEGPLPVVIDESGLVESCLQTDTSNGLTGTISVTNPFEANAIHVEWSPGACDGEILFTLRSDADGYELLGERPIDCATSSGSLPVYITFSRPMPADIVSASLRDLPPAATPGPSPPSSTIECAGSPRRPSNGAVWIEDHAGLVTACEVGASDPPDETSLFFGTDPPSVTLSWMTSCAADRELTELQLWSRAARAPVEPWTPFTAPFLLVVNRVPPADPLAGCRTMINGRRMTIYLNKPISAEEVEWFLTMAGQGLGTAMDDDRLFELSIETAKTEYQADEPIDLDISLLYEGPDRKVSYPEHMAPVLHIEQLDGDLEMASTFRDLDCAEAGPISLDSGGPQILSYQKGLVYSEADPNAAFYADYFNVPELRLPAGAYRLRVWLALWTDNICTPLGTPIELVASVVIDVR